MIDEGPDGTIEVLPETSANSDVPAPKQPSSKSVILVVSTIILVILLGIIAVKFTRRGGKKPVTRPLSSPTEAPRPSPSDAGGSSSGSGFCDKGSTISCSELGSVWRSGTGVCMTDESGYDVSSCVASGKGEMVKPAERDPKRWATARCNDGTPFGFEVELSDSGSKDWVLYLQGGGFCDDDIIPCRERSEQLRSSPKPQDKAGAPLAQEGILGRTKATNPTFAQANHVFAYYCSSDGWSGATASKHANSASQGGWYFSGRLNVAAMTELLKMSYGLDDTNKETTVLLTGGSAGGAGAMANADNLASLLPKTAKRGALKILNDAGHIPDFDNPNYRPKNSTLSVRDALVKATSFWGSRLNPLCENAHPGNPGECFFTDIVHSYISDPPPKGLGLPFMLQASSIDSFVMGLHGIDNATRDKKAIEEYRGNALASFRGIDWVFSGGEKPYHMTLLKDGPQGWHMGPNGDTLEELVTRFWEGKPPKQVLFGN
ncbi:MAG: pectin acetylesterase-family hydrolase [bacterium]|nr:pectin acetylesterase-family hydrolase [bacterium]